MQSIAFLQRLGDLGRPPRDVDTRDRFVLQVPGETACSGVVAPDVFSPVLATEVILWVAIGGKGTLGGPVLTAVGLTLLKQTVSSATTDGWPLLLGALFLCCVLFLPNGVQLGGLIVWARRIDRIRRGRSPLHRPERVEGGR